MNSPPPCRWAPVLDLRALLDIGARACPRWARCGVRVRKVGLGAREAAGEGDEVGVFPDALDWVCSPCGLPLDAGAEACPRMSENGLCVPAVALIGDEPIEDGGGVNRLGARGILAVAVGLGWTPER